MGLSNAGGHDLDMRAIHAVLTLAADVSRARQDLVNQLPSAASDADAVLLRRAAGSISRVGPQTVADFVRSIHDLVDMIASLEAPLDKEVMEGVAELRTMLAPLEALPVDDQMKVQAAARGIHGLMGILQEQSAFATLRSREGILEPLRSLPVDCPMDEVLRAAAKAVEGAVGESPNGLSALGLMRDAAAQYRALEDDQGSSSVN